MIGLAASALSALALTSAAAQQDVSTYINPILDQEVPDPSVANVGGTLYIYGTGQTSADKKNRPDMYVPMTSLSGTDFNGWATAKGVLKRPSWAQGGTWAPHVVANPDQSNPARRYVMFFSASARDGNSAGVVAGSQCMGVAFSAAPGGDFVALDRPLDTRICKTAEHPKVKGNIDPFFYVDPNDGNKKWLYWGSIHVPLKRQQVADDLTSLLGSGPQDLSNVDFDSKKVVPMKGTDPRDAKVEYTDMLEGSWIIYRAPYYYLFTSGYSCCNPKSDPKGYAAVVWRTKSLANNAAWERRPANDPDTQSTYPSGSILRSSGAQDTAFESPGHNSIFKDGAGKWWIVYHARKIRGTDHLGDRVLMMDKLDWNPDGWPRILHDHDGAPFGEPGTPTEERMPRPAVPLP